MSSASRLGSDVRITEVDLSATLQQNSSITAAMVWVGGKGRTGPQYYTNYDRIQQDYGPLKTSVSYDMLSAKAYCEEGSGIWINRVVGSGATFGGLLMCLDASNATVFVPVTVSSDSVIDWASITPTNHTPVTLFTPRCGQGSFSSGLALSVNSANLAAPTNGAATSASSGGGLATGTYHYKVVAVDAEGNQSAASADISVSHSSGSTNASVLTWDKSTGAASYMVFGRKNDTSFGFISYVNGTNPTFTDTGAITPDTTVVPYTALNVPTSPHFTLMVYDESYEINAPRETFRVSLVEETDDTGVQMEVSQNVNAFSDLIRAQSYVPALVSTPKLMSLARTNLPAGASGTAPTAVDINNGWAAFKDKQAYVIDVMINSGRTSPAVQRAMDALAAKRQDCVAFLDTPSTLQRANDAIGYRRATLNINSSYSALFCPDLYVLDDSTAKFLYVPPSGAMAALLARTTRVAQPWFSMAGLNRGLVNALSTRYSYDEDDSTALYQAQVNYMRKFLGQGIPLWEQSTLQAKSSALQFLNVRVLCNVVKRSTYQYLIYSLQEPGDEVLQRNIKSGLEEYFDYVEGKRGIRRYMVACGPSNNDAASANLGVTKVAVVIVPTLGTRAIEMTLAIGKQGLQVTEKDIAAF